jgi:hypothetical protein
MSSLNKILPPVTSQKYPCLISLNMGKPTIKMTLPIDDFYRMSEVYNRDFVAQANLPEDSEAQRVESSSHTLKLARYIISGLFEQRIRDMKQQGESISNEIKNLKEQIGLSTYCAMQPITCNLRDVGKDGENLDIELLEFAEGKKSNHDIALVSFRKTQKLAVVDGQHRRSACGVVLNWLDKINKINSYPKGGIFNPPTSNTGLISLEIKKFWGELLNDAMSNSYVSIECHLGATVQEERQLFSDLNYRGKKVSSAQNLDYDTSDPLNSLIHDFIDNGIFKFTPRETDESDWQKEEVGLPRKDLNSITSFAMMGKGNASYALPYEIRQKRAFAEKFWTLIQSSPHFLSKRAKSKTVLIQTVVLKGLAKLAHEFALGKGTTKNEDHLKLLLDALKTDKIDFSHSNKAWRSLMWGSEKRKVELPGIEDYVFVPTGTNLDAGTYDVENNWVRYGSKHNDIYRRIGDLIRFQLELPPRQEVTNAIAKEEKGIKNK